MAANRKTRENFIDNPDAYEQAIARNIRANAAKGRHARFFANNEDAQEIYDFCNQFADKSAFLGACFDAFQQWGAPTEKMVAAVRENIRKRKERLTLKKLEDSKSQHVGAIGERRNFTLKVKFRTGFESAFGWTNVIGFTDEAGNVYIYKGASAPADDRAESLTFKATIKEHGEREGVKQTILARPKW